MTPKRVTTIRIDESILAGLQTVKERDGVPVSEQVRRALSLWLEQKGIVKSDRTRASTRKRP
jgi:hypothetical protein